MKTVKFQFFMELAKTNFILTRKLDAGLGGLGFTEFMILFYLNQHSENQMRRTDLAEKVGLTASGVTRLLLPMEKIGLVKRLSDKHDARVSFVALAPGGKRKLTEAVERAEFYAEELLGGVAEAKINDLVGVIKQISKNS